MAKTFHNTINVEGQMLMDFTAKAWKQNDIILELFRLNAYRSMTPFEVQKCLQLQGKDYPITSIRRAITTLTEEGKLMKLHDMKAGDYGKPNHTWRFKTIINHQTEIDLCQKS